MFKKNLMYAAFAALTLLSWSCSEDKEELPDPVVTVDNVTVEGNSLSFQVSAANAVACSYYLSRSADLASTINATYVLASGTPVALDGPAKIEIKDLDYDTEYSILAAAVNLSGVYAFKTEKVKIEPEPWTLFEKPANTYIVTEAGSYGFNPLKVDGTPIEIASADWIWATSEETFAQEQHIISEVSYTDGVVRFKTLGNEGNAVISGFDAAGNVVWSWLVWCTDQPQDVQITEKAYFLDRVIGATGSTQEDGVKAWSVILYQYARISPIFGGYADEWGEKEVFNEARKYTVMNKAHAFEWTVSTGQMPSSAEADKHPTTFYTGTGNKKDGLWCSAPWDWNFLGLWYGKVTDWTKRERFKTNLDPCPAGYRIPSGEDWGSTADFKKNLEPVGTPQDPIGWNYTFNGKTVWFPCGNAGRIDVSGELARGFNGNTFLWGAGMANLGMADWGFVEDAYTSRWSFCFEGIGTSVETAANPSFGFGIRCVKYSDQ